MNAKVTASGYMEAGNDLSTSGQWWLDVEFFADDDPATVLFSHRFHIAYGTTRDMVVDQVRQFAKRVEYARSAAARVPLGAMLLRQ